MSTNAKGTVLKKLFGTNKSVLIYAWVTGVIIFYMANGMRYVVSSPLQIDSFKLVPLPAFSDGKGVPSTSADYHNVPFDKNDKRATEPLVRLDKYGIACDNFYARTDGFNAPYYRSFESASRKGRIRESLALKLQKINDMLNDSGLELLVFDAYRPVACQYELWSYFLSRAKSENPKASEAEAIALASRYCSNPDKFTPSDWHTWPSHCTGGAVDLTLRRKDNGEQLFMGSIFDDDSPVSHSAYFETVSPLTASARAARDNRRILYWAMKQVGFENYPYEWWHFDYGDQLWVLDSKNAQINKAFYGAAGK